MSGMEFGIYAYAMFVSVVLACTAEPGSWLDRAWRAIADRLLR